MDKENCNAFNYDFSSLPPHVTVHILQHLELKDFKNAGTVCKSWHHASTDPKLVRSLTLAPSEDNFLEICESNRMYGELKLEFFEFDKEDEYYFKLFEKFCPFIHKLTIIECNLKIHHLLKLFELTTKLESVSLYEGLELEDLPRLFPVDYDPNSKSQIKKNLSGIKTILIEDFINIPLTADLVRYATNLISFEFTNDSRDFDGYEGGNPYTQFFKIFDNDNTDNLKNLKLHLNFSGSGYADDFITNFINIKSHNLKSFDIILWWKWKDGTYKSDLFRQLLVKLENLEEFTIYGFLIEDQLSLICQHLMNLKSLDCLLHQDQPLPELANLKQLEKLYCRFSQDHNRCVNFVTIEELFKCKFEHLRVFYFEEFVNEQNLVQFCENHPDLIELHLNLLLTPNLEVIFKHLTKLRVLIINFRLLLLKVDDLYGEYEYKISRLKDLEVFHLNERINGIHRGDLMKLEKLRSTNLPELYNWKNPLKLNK